MASEPLPKQPSNYPAETPDRAFSMNLGGGGPDPMSERLDIRQYISVVLAYWWVVLLCLVLGTTVGAIYCVFKTPVFRANCRYELLRDPRLTLGLEGSGPLGGVSVIERQLMRQVVIMRSGAVVGRVRERLKAKWEAQLEEEHLTPKVGVSTLREASSMVDIQVDAVDRDYAKDFLEELLRVHQDLRREEMLENTDRALTNLRREQEDLQRELEAAQEALTQFEQKHNLMFTQTRSVYDERFLANLIQRENVLRMEKAMLESQYSFLETADAETIREALALTLQTHDLAADVMGMVPPEGATEVAAVAEPVRVSAGDLRRVQMTDGSGWLSTEAEVVRLKTRLEDMAETYKPDHPKMIELRKQLEEAERNLRLNASIALRRISARLRAVTLQMEALSKAARAWRKELELTTEQRADHANLVRKVTRLKELFDQVYSRILDNSLVNVDPYSSRLVEPVSARMEPVRPNKPLTMVIAIVISLGTGVGLAFVLDYLDTSFLDVMAIEQRLGLQYISGVPNWGRVLKAFNPEKDRVLVTRDKSDICTETYRTLRASLETAMGNESNRVLMLTSGDEGEGKTQTALNLAIVFSWSGKRVLLVDGDMRRGGCHRPLEVPGKPGICEWLLGDEGDWRALVRDTSYENLKLLPAGKFRQEVPEMLSAARFEAMLEDCRKEYDLVILDSAPVGRVVDTSLLARLCDHVLLIVRHGEARFANVRHALHRLAGANVIGFCLNGIDLGRRRRGYYGYYGRYYYGRYAYYPYFYSYPGYGYRYPSYGGYGSAAPYGGPPAPYGAPPPVPYGPPVTYGQPYQKESGDGSNRADRG